MNEVDRFNHTRRCTITPDDATQPLQVNDTVERDPMEANEINEIDEIDAIDTIDYDRTQSCSKHSIDAII